MAGCRFCAALDALSGREHVITSAGHGKVAIGGAEATDAQLAELASEAELLRRTSLWKALTATARDLATDLGIRQAKDFDQLMFAKAMLHVVGIQESAVEAVLAAAREVAASKV